MLRAVIFKGSEVHLALKILGGHRVRTLIARRKSLYERISLLGRRTADIIKVDKSDNDERNAGDENREPRPCPSPLGAFEFLNACPSLIFPCPLIAFRAQDKNHDEAHKRN